MGRRWVKARKHDSYFRAAKRMAYRSRAAFKLQQIQARFGVVRPGDTVVDLGAAPGGWSQVAGDLVGPRGRVVAVDIMPMAAVQGVEVVRGDFTDERLLVALLERLGGPADVVLCDAAPKLSGVRSIDQVRAIGLARAALDIAGRALRPGGAFASKAFRGSEYAPFLQDVRVRFDAVHEYTPKASPRGSAEVYVVAIGRR